MKLSRVADAERTEQIADSLSGGTRIARHSGKLYKHLSVYVYTWQEKKREIFFVYSR